MIKSPAKKQGILCLSDGRNRAALLLNISSSSGLEWSVASRLPARQKAPLRQKLHPPLILSEPLPLLGISSSSGLEWSVASRLPTR